MIHDMGCKAPRDRAKIMGKYAELCRFMHVRRLPEKDLAKLTNEQFFRLCEDTYNRQPDKKKIAYAEHIGAVPRSKPDAFHWFVSDLLRYKGTSSLMRAWLIITAPVRYPGFLSRRAKRKAAEAKAARVKTICPRCDRYRTCQGPAECTNPEMLAVLKEMSETNRKALDFSVHIPSLPIEEKEAQDLASGMSKANISEFPRKA